MKDRDIENIRGAVEDVLRVVVDRNITLSELNYILGQVKELADTTVIVPTKKEFFVPGQKISIDSSSI